MNKSPFENQFNKGKRIAWLSVFGSLTQGLANGKADMWLREDNEIKQLLDLTDKITAYVIKKYPPENGEESKSLDENDEAIPY